MLTFPLVSFLLAALLFVGLSGLLVTAWRGRLTGGYLLLATVATALWAGLFAVQLLYQVVPAGLIWAAELARSVTWLLFMLHLLQGIVARESKAWRWLWQIRWLLLLAAVVSLLPFEGLLSNFGLANAMRTGLELRLIFGLLFAVLGLTLVEQTYRNTPLERRWQVKFLCLGLGATFAFDFYMYADALLLQRLDPVLWQSRGAIYLLLAPMIAITASRNPDWSVPIFISRHVVFHTTTLFGAAAYLLVMAMAGYYLRSFGGSWGAVLQVIFLFGAVLLLAVLLFSGQMRARLKVFLGKHFFKYQYDYRDEWLRLIHTLAGHGSRQPLNERVILAIGQIVDSNGGQLWLRDQRMGWECAACLECQPPVKPRAEDLHALDSYLASQRWVVDLKEYEQDPGLYEGLDLPAAVKDWLPDQWLIVPLIHDEDLSGFVVLRESRAPQKLNWESLDLLKTVGYQAAGYLALQQAAQALTEAQQFEGFNRLSAYVIHDLKNLIAQLSLVASNAAKHKHNPAFIDDAVTTIENSVARMNRLMAQLKSNDLGHQHKTVALAPLLREVVERHGHSRPVPALELELDGEVFVEAEPERLNAVIGHVIQNAQDATPAEGEVRVSARCLESQVMVEVADTGTGMDEEFIRSRLFRPFDTTKGLTGMGIGAYECREFLLSIGGEVEVDSALGEGTRFRMRLPLAVAP